MTQNEMILKYLQDNGEITPLDALREFGCMRLASRISELRAKGYPITSELKLYRNTFGKNTNYAVYRLEKGAKEWQEQTTLRS